jgi:heme-degrading monooxygenase HmoA
MKAYPPGAVAVIFVSQRSAIDPEGYAQAANQMAEAAARFPGYLGAHSARGEDGLGITVSYWADDQSARAWKADADHSSVRERGRAGWYDWYELIVAKVDRAYDWKAGPPKRKLDHENG